MKRILLILAAASLCLTACDQKPAEAPAETKKTDEAKKTDAKAEGDTKADEKAKAEGDKKAEAKKTGDDGHRKGVTEEEKAAAKAAGILGVGEVPPDIKPGEKNVYGGRFTIIEEPIALGSAIQEGSTDTIKVSAKVEKACQMKGCWMTLVGEGVDLPIRVKMKDYKFFVPKNAGGSTAVIEGTLKKTVIKQAEAQHYEDDAVKGTDKKPKQITGDVDSYMFMASAIELTMPKS